MERKSIKILIIFVFIQRLRLWIIINFEKVNLKQNLLNNPTRMAPNKSLIDIVYDSQEQFMPYCAFSEDSVSQYLYGFGEAQIEQSHYEPNKFTDPQNHHQNLRKLTENIFNDQDDLKLCVQNPLCFQRGLSQLSAVQLNCEDSQSEIYEESSSKNETNPSKTQLNSMLPLPSKKKIIKKNQTKSKVQLLKEKKSQKVADEVYKPRTNLSSPNRKGKHSQSMSQKFIYFMTRYHYSKNFYQYYRKQIIQKAGSLCNYSTKSAAQKIAIVEEIKRQLSSYRMAVHYSVEKGEFLNSFFVHQQNLIKQLFWQVIQQTYKIRFELEKKYIEEGQSTEKPQKHKFFDQNGEKVFNAIFDTMLTIEPFASVLIDCNFVERFEQAFNKKEGL